MKAKPTPTEPSADTLPRIIGRDELNLAEFPLTALAHRVADDCRELVYQDHIRDQSSGEVIPRKLTITGDAKYGLPTSLDDDVIVALIHTTKEANNFTARTVPFSRMAVVELLGWPRNGQSFRRLDESLNRWLGVTLRYQNAWWDKAAQTWVNESFHILDNLTIYDQQTSRRIQKNPAQISLPLSTFSWNEIVFKSFQAENLKRLDLSLYFKLSLSPSKRAYRFLDKRFYRNPLQKFDLRYFACEHIGFSRDYNAAKIKEKLQPALDELEDVGFLEPMSRDTRYEKVSHGEWRIVLHQGQGSKPPEPKSADEPPEASPPPLVAELIQRGVTADTARQLAAQHSEEKIRQQIEIFDWRLAGKKADKIDDPAAWLVSAIRLPNGHAVPKGFISRAERQKREEAKRQAEQKAAEERRQKQEAAAREQAEQKALDARWQSLSPEELAQLDEEVLAEAGDQAQETYATLKRLTGGGTGYLVGLRRDHLRKQLQAEGKPVLTGA